MKPGRPSYTAEGAAALRALEGTRRPGHRVFEDPYAKAFLTLRTRWRLWPGTRSLAERLIERVLPGVISFTAVRVRWMDDLLVRLAPELEQIVILGAGYDTTFARHPEFLQRLDYFEVDHPTTGAAKKARIALRPDIFGDMFSRVRTVHVDFEREDLLERLRANGYDPSRRTAYVWSGVTMYLERPAVESTLRIIGQSAPGSHLIADLVARRGLGDARSSRSLRYFQKRGEPIRFLIDPGEIKQFIAPFGLEVEEIAVGEALRERYFAADDPRRLTKYGYLLHASVPPRGSAGTQA